MGQKLSVEDNAKPFRRKFRKNATKLFLPAVFPDTRVDLAYLHPEVDKDPSVFQWGVPDLDALRSFLMATIGWSQERTDEVLVPVIKDMNRRENEGTQANITQFFSGGVGVGSKPSNGGGGAFAPRRRIEGKSKRMETALERLHARASNRTNGEEPTAAGAAAVVNSESFDHGGIDVHENEPAGNGIQGQRPLPKSRSKKRAAPETTRDTDTDTETLGDDEYETPTMPRKRGKAATRGRKKTRTRNSESVWSSALHGSVA